VNEIWHGTPPKCKKCGSESNTTHLWCQKCGDLIELEYNYKNIQKPENIESIWSFKSLFPNFETSYSLIEGNTPIFKIKRMDPISGIHVKLENRNPTGSFRDRASSLIISHALSLKSKKIVNSTTGSFGISLAAYCAGANLECVTFVPESTDLSKLALLKIYGSSINDSADSIEELTEHAKTYAKDNGGYLPLPSDNLLMIEGQKTIGLELALELPNLENLIIPRGSGSLIYSIYRGYADALECGWIDSIPKFYPVGLQESEIHHVVESLEYRQPKLLKQVEFITKNTNSKEITINPVEMIDMALLLAKTNGLFIDPGSASVISAANLLAEKDEIDIDSTCLILSGTGFSSMNIFSSHLRETQKAIWGLSDGSTTKFEIMSLICENKANYGYAIWKALGKKQSLQSIYQHLNDIEEKGYIYFEEQGKKKKIVASKKGIEWYNGMKDLINKI
jgi:threonine synthase